MNTPNQKKAPTQPLSLLDIDMTTGVEEVVEPRSFRNQLISALAYTAIVPLLMLALFQQQQFKTAMQTADNAQLSLAQNIAFNVSQYVEDSLHLVQFGNELIETFGNGQEVGKQTAIQKIVKQHAVLLAIRLLDPKTSQVISVGKTPQALESLGHPGEYSQSLGEAEAIVRTVIFQNEHPGIVISTQPNISTQGAWAEGLFSFEPIVATVTRFLGQERFDVAVIDKTGKTIYCFMQSGTADSAIDIMDADMKQRIAQGEKKFIYRSQEKRDVAQIKAYVQIERLGWSVVVTQPLSRREEAMRTSLETSGFLLLLAILATILVGTGMASPLNRSINELMVSVERFGRTGKFSKFSSNLEKGGTTELVALAKCFERMVVAVQQSKGQMEQLNSQLENQVAERTATLMSRNSELRALQILLMPIHSSKKSMQDIVDGSIEQFQALLGLPSLVYNPIDNASKELVSKQTSFSQAIPVQLADHIFGVLQTSEQGPLSTDRVDSLGRLANSLAIVLSNEALVRELAKEHETLVAVFESMSDGVLIIGRSGRITYSNELARTILNQGKEIIGCCALELIESQWSSREVLDLDTDGTIVRKMRRTEVEQYKTVDFVTFKVSDLPNMPGQRTGLLIRDVTHEAQVDAMKDNLASVVAHELKTPVTALRLQAESIQRNLDQNKETAKEEMIEMLDEATRLGQLIDDLLDVSQIEAGVMKLVYKVVHVASLIDRASRLTKSRYPFEVTRHIEDDAEVICVDPERITQVFVNLFNNAARYKKQSQPVAQCSVCVTVEETNIRIVVTDQGVGIDPQKSSHIFERFYQSDMTATRVGGGTGLGLSIVRGIVRAHGGDVIVQSEVGIATSFIVLLPVR